MEGYPLTHARFKEGLAQGRLLGLKCLDCGAWTVPPQATCSACGRFRLEVGEVAPRGQIRTFTVIRVPPVGFEAPYILALVELEDGPWVLGNLLDFDPDRAGLDLIGRKVSVGGRLRPPDQTRGGAQAAVLTFNLLD